MKVNYLIVSLALTASGACSCSNNRANSVSISAGTVQAVDSVYYDSIQIAKAHEINSERMLAPVGFESETEYQIVIKELCEQLKYDFDNYDEEYVINESEAALTILDLVEDKNNLDVKSYLKFMSKSTKEERESVRGNERYEFPIGCDPDITDEYE